MVDSNMSTFVSSITKAIPFCILISRKFFACKAVVNSVSPSNFLEYSKNQIQKAKKYFDQLSQLQRSELTENILSGLPGSEETYSIDLFKKKELREHFLLSKIGVEPLGRELTTEYLQNNFKTNKIELRSYLIIPC